MLRAPLTYSFIYLGFRYSTTPRVSCLHFIRNPAIILLQISLNCLSDHFLLFVSTLTHTKGLEQDEESELSVQSLTSALLPPVALWKWHTTAKTHLFSNKMELQQPYIRTELYKSLETVNINSTWSTRICLNFCNSIKFELFNTALSDFFIN